MSFINLWVRWGTDQSNDPYMPIPRSAIFVCKLSSQYDVYSVKGGLVPVLSAVKTPFIGVIT